MARKSTNISILQVDGRQLARLRVRPGAQGVEVVGYDAESGLWAREDGSLEAALRAFAQKHALAEDAIYTVLPRHDVTARILTLPTHDPGEAASMVRLSAEEFVPYSADELIIDQSLLRKLPGGESTVLAVLAHRDVVEGHLALLAKAGLEPEQIFLSTACLASAAIALGAAPAERFAVVELGAAGIEVAVIDHGRLVYTRGVATALDWSNAEAAEAALGELAVEVRGSLAAYRRESEDGLGVEHLLLASSVTDAAPIVEPLSLEIAKEIAVADVTPLAQGQTGALTGQPLSLLGGALAAQDRAATAIRLLPESVQRGRALEGAKKTLIHAAAAVAVVCVALGAAYGQAVYQRTEYIRELSKQVRQVEPKARGVAAKQHQLSILRRQVERTGSALELLATTVEAAPEGTVNISRWGFERGTGINIWGRAMTVDDVHAFAQNLRSMGVGHLSLFAQARSLYEKKDTEHNQTVYSYNIAVQRPSGEEEKEGAADE